MCSDSNMLKCSYLTPKYLNHACSLLYYKFTWHFLNEFTKRSRFFPTLAQQYWPLRRLEQVQDIRPATQSGKFKCLTIVVALHVANIIIHAAKIIKFCKSYKLSGFKLWWPKTTGYSACMHASVVYLFCCIKQQTNKQTKTNKYIINKG